MNDHKTDQPPKTGSIQKPHIVILFIVLLATIIWQYSFILNKEEIDNSYRNQAFSALKSNYSAFAYFYYYLDFFPLTSTLFLEMEHIPSQYLSKEAAQDIIDNQPETLRMDHNFRIRNGNLGKIWLFMPEAIFTGSPSSLSVHAFHSILFIFGMLALLVSAWRLSLFPLGALIVLFVGSHPFQLWELYGNPGKGNANMGNLFSLNIIIAIIALAFFLPVIFNRRVSHRYLWVLMIASGVVGGTLLQVRTEPVMILATCLLIILLYSQIEISKRAFYVLLSVIVFMISAFSWTAYFDAKFEETYQIVTEVGGPALPKGLDYHGLWDSLWLGLGDYDNKYGMEWSDSVLYAVIRPQMEEAGLYDFDRIPGDPEIYKKPLFLMPDYDRFVRDDLVLRLTNDPIWYLTILLKRAYSIFVNVTPANIAIAGRSVTLVPPGVHIFLIIGLLAYFKRWDYLKLMLFVSPLSATPLMIYSLEGVTYYSIMLQVGVAITIYLVGLALLSKRKVLPE